MVSFLQSLLLLFHFCHPFTIIWACMEAGRRNKLSIGIKALPILWSAGSGNKRNAKKSRFRPNRNSAGTIYHWSVTLRRFSGVSNSAKRDANGFFKVLLLSTNLLISRHPVQKSKFGACAVTGYCSFKLIFYLNSCVRLQSIHRCKHIQRIQRCLYKFHSRDNHNCHLCIHQHLYRKWTWVW